MVDVLVFRIFTFPSYNTTTNLSIFNISIDFIKNKTSTTILMNVPVADKMVTKIYPPLESIKWDQHAPNLFIVADGMVASNGKVMQKMAFWGEDMMLDTPKLTRNSEAKALSYAEVSCVYFTLSNHCP